MFYHQILHPSLIPAGLCQAIRDYKGDGGLRQLLLKHHNRILDIEVPDPNVLVDMDRPEDFDFILASIGKRGLKKNF